MGLLSRRKGAAWERALVHRFAEVFGGDRVRRGLQYRDGTDCPDVLTPCFWVEAKCGEQTNPRAALAQALDDAAGKGLWPVAVCKDDYQEPFVVMTLEDFLELSREWWSTREAK